MTRRKKENNFLHFFVFLTLDLDVTVFVKAIMYYKVQCAVAGITARGDRAVGRGGGAGGDEGRAGASSFTFGC